MSAGANNELPSVYEDDVVCLLDEEGNEVEGYGIVLETAWDSDADEEQVYADDEQPTNTHNGATNNAPNHTNNNSRRRTAGDDAHDDEDDEDEEDPDKLQPGHCRIAWPDRVSEALPVENLRVVDRSFLHGDVVVRQSDPQGQVGTVIDVELLVDITFDAVNGGPDAITLHKQSSKICTPAHPYIIGRYVTKGTQLGLIQNAMVQVDIAFGPPHAPTAVCRLTKPAPSVYKPQLDNSEEVHEDDVGHGIYFPGMRVRAKHANWRRPSVEWLSGSHAAAAAAKEVGTVISVVPLEVHVEWISGTEDFVNEDGYTDSVLAPGEVTLLGLFEETRWQVGDHCMLNEEAREMERARVMAEHPQDTPAAAAAASDASAASSSAKPKKSKSNEELPHDWSHAFSFCGTITRTYTSVRVEWQDGTVSESFTPSLDYISRDHLLDNDFLPHDYAIVMPSYRLVHVLAVDPAERMVKIRYLPKRLRQYAAGQWWEAREEDGVDGDDPDAHTHTHAHRTRANERAEQNAPNASPLVFAPPARSPESIDETDTKEEGYEEWVPVFELRTDPHFEFSLGSAVIRIPGSADDQANQALPPDTRLGQAGQILSMHDGLLTVVWSDLTQSTVEVDQVMIVDHEHYEEEEEYGCELCADTCGDECECDCHYEDDQAEEGEEGNETAHGGNDNEANGDDETVNNDEFPSEWTRPSHWNRSGANANANANSNNAPAAPTAADNADAQADEATAAVGNLSLAASAAVALASSAAPALPHIEPSKARVGFSYSSFDIIETPEVAAAAAAPAAASANSLSLHHKYESAPFAPHNQKAFVKRIRDEWKLLEKNLPPGIHVMTYESRMDLFKILMIGNTETPYFLNVFQFDLALPADYPASPPLVHFYSRGHRLNPNLYIDGNVCLSLLNTWKSSHVTQRWDPAHSNLLQVLVSIQGLVIGVADPYYLEAGYERQKGLAQACMNSHLYNETALVLSLTHLTSYTAAPLQAHPFGLVVLEHVLSEEFQARVRQLDRIAHAWEAQKRANFASFGASSTSTTVDASTSGSELDETELATALARFAIRAGRDGELVVAPPPKSAAATAVTPNASAASSSSSSSAAPSSVEPQPLSSAKANDSTTTATATTTTTATATTAAAAAAAADGDRYHPSLGFVAMLARQTKALVGALDKTLATNAAQPAQPAQPADEQ